MMLVLASHTVTFTLLQSMAIAVDDVGAADNVLLPKKAKQAAQLDSMGLLLLVRTVIRIWRCQEAVVHERGILKLFLPQVHHRLNCFRT